MNARMHSTFAMTIHKMEVKRMESNNRSQGIATHSNQRSGQIKHNNQNTLAKVFNSHTKIEKYIHGG
jgi:hypothetical protein